MDETTLRALLDHATSSEPPFDRPSGRIIADSRRAGGRLRWRRLIATSTASVVGVAGMAIGASFAWGASGNAHNPSPVGHAGRSGGMAYVLTMSGTVVPVNLATMKAGRPLQTGLDPAWARRLTGGLDGPDIVAARGGKTLYVSIPAKPKVLHCPAHRTCTEQGRGVILPVSTATGRIARPIRVAAPVALPDNLVSTPNGEVAYAIDVGRGGLNPTAKMTAIDLATGTKLGQMSPPYSALEHAAVSLNSKTLLLNGAGSGGAETASVVDVASERAQKPISLKFRDDAATCAAVSPDGGTGYITTVPSFESAVRLTAVMVPIDVSTNRALRAIKLPTELYSTRGPGLCSMAVAPNGRTAYVLVQRWVMPIDLVTGRALKPIELPGAWFGINPELVINPDGRVAYALTREGVTPIDLATNTALPTIRIGNPSEQVEAGTFLAFSANGKIALVGLFGRDKLLPIQAATGKAGKPIQLPGRPVAIAVTP
jgi:DNA-binding beta-propeller fold protein YncE